MALISVIVPIHNIEQYLSKCIESILNQTYKNLEIILVNDGSTDNSLSICRQYEEDNRIKIIDKQCGGVSDARNAGIKAASGEYIFLLDGDDYILKNAIELMYKGVTENNADIAICNYKKVTSDIDLVDESNIEAVVWKVLNQEEAIAGLVSGKPFYSLAWNKLYKKSIFDNYLFNVGKINEDEFAAHNIYGCISKAICTDKSLYAYVQHQGSIMTKYSVKRHDKAEALKERIEYLKKIGCPKYIIKDATFRYLIEELNFNYNINRYILSVNEKELVEKYYAEAKNVYHNSFREFNLIEHSKIIMIRFFPKLYRYLRKSCG